MPITGCFLFIHIVTTIPYRECNVFTWNCKYHTIPRMFRYRTVLNRGYTYVGYSKVAQHVAGGGVIPFLRNNVNYTHTKPNKKKRTNNNTW